MRVCNSWRGLLSAPQRSKANSSGVWGASDAAKQHPVIPKSWFVESEFKLELFR